ncbi:MAG: hypothetical protein M3Y82_08415 [Verrucomicrobiota bacterium]|nr:hypothetical protein [Verrucomicrobiota bacterium]
MNKLRKLHLFLGCFFSPILLFFICTGWYQTLHPDRRKGAGEAEGIIDRARSVHADSLLPSASAQTYSTKPFRYFVVVMAIALIATIILGLILAFRFHRKKWQVWLSLILGLLVPLFLLWLGQKR